MKTVMIEDEAVPNFCWDRKLTAGEIREHLHNGTRFEWVQLASWILREAAYADVWSFLAPSEISEHMAELSPFLGRRRDFWEYLVGAWHELERL